MASEDDLGELARRWGPQGAARLAVQPLLTSHAMMFPTSHNPRTIQPGPEIKKRLTAAVDAIIDYLDAVDGDPDLEVFEVDEDGGDLEPGSDIEPSLGWPEFNSHGGELITPGVAVDVED